MLWLLVLSVFLLLTAGPALAQTCEATLTATNGALVEWRGPTKRDLTLIGYVVVRSGVDPVELPQVSANTLRYEDAPLIPGEHLYNVHAVYKMPDGGEVRSGPGTWGTPEPCILMVVAEPPTGVTASPFASPVADGPSRSPGRRPRPKR